MQRGKDGTACMTSLPPGPSLFMYTRCLLSLLYCSHFTDLTHKTTFLLRNIHKNCYNQSCSCWLQICTKIICRLELCPRPLQKLTILPRLPNSFKSGAPGEERRGRGGKRRNRGKGKEGEVRREAVPLIQTCRGLCEIVCRVGDKSMTSSDLSCTSL